MPIADLHEDLLLLRTRWPQEWPGMAWVLSACLSRLSHPQAEAGPGASTQASARYAILHKAAFAMADAVEALHAAMANEDREAAYHNRLHFAECTFSLCVLLRAAREGLPLQPSLASLEQEMLMLLVMLAHDLGHDGRVNSKPSEMETLSANAAVRLLGAMDVSSADLRVIEGLIRGTDPAMVRDNHRAILGHAFSLEDPKWLQVLANEADILASTLPQFGSVLAEALAREWRQAHPQRADSVRSDEGRLFFLEHAALFSSPGSAILGLGALRQHQIDALRSRLASS